MFLVIFINIPNNQFLIMEKGDKRDVPSNRARYYLWI